MSYKGRTGEVGGFLCQAEKITAVSGFDCRIALVPFLSFFDPCFFPFKLQHSVKLQFN